MGKPVVLPAAEAKYLNILNEMKETVTGVLASSKLQLPVVQPEVLSQEVIRSGADEIKFRRYVNSLTDFDISQMTPKEAGKLSQTIIDSPNKEDLDDNLDYDSTVWVKLFRRSEEVKCKECNDDGPYGKIMNTAIKHVFLRPTSTKVLSSNS
jgi:hypothetical protein